MSRTGAKRSIATQSGKVSADYSVQGLRFRGDPRTNAGEEAPGCGARVVALRWRLARS